MAVPSTLHAGHGIIQGDRRPARVTLSGSPYWLTHWCFPLPTLTQGSSISLVPDPALGWITKLKDIRNADSFQALLTPNI